MLSYQYLGSGISPAACSLSGRPATVVKRLPLAMVAAAEAPGDADAPAWVSVVRTRDPRRPGLRDLQHTARRTSSA